MTSIISKTLRPRLCALFAALLAVSSVAGCDPDASAEGLEGETDADPDTDDGDMDSGEGSQDASSGDGPGDSDGSDEPEDPTDEPEDPTDGPPFDDDPQAALGALSGMGYICYDAEDTSFNLLFNADGVTALFEDDTTSAGTYDTSGGSLTVSFDELGFTESATDAAVALDALVYFETPNLQCGAYAFDHTAVGEADVVDCPTIKYIPETSWENNQFHFSDGGYVRRRRWTELPAVPDTLYAVRLGVYRVVGNQVFIVLPFEDEGEQWLTGTLTTEGLYIDQLEPEQGACE